MEFSQHALEKCTLYGVNPELVREALTVGETFLDLTPDDARVITVYPTLQGIPDLVVEGDGYTIQLEPNLLCLRGISDGIHRLLAEPIKQQLPVGLGD
jgi:hypothetical protein